MEKNIFTRHVKDINESYFENMGHILYFCRIFFKASVMLLIHCIFPFIFVATVSSKISKLNKIMSARAQIIRLISKNYKHIDNKKVIFSKDRINTKISLDCGEIGYGFKTKLTKQLIKKQIAISDQLELDIISIQSNFYVIRGLNFSSSFVKLQQFLILQLECKNYQKKF